MLIGVDLIQVICEYSKLKTQVILCNLNKICRNYIKIYELLGEYRLNDCMLKQSKFDNLKKLNASTSKIKDIGHLIYLEVLLCHGTGCLISDDDIKNLYKLKVLNISDNDNIRYIGHLTDLEELDCSRSWIIKGNNLKNLLRLKKLVVHYAPHINDINHLYHLKELYCEGNSGISDEDIVNLTNLEILNAFNNNKITQFDRFINLKQFKSSDSYEWIKTSKFSSI